jgi:hypothetical protein
LISFAGTSANRMAFAMTGMSDPGLRLGTVDDLLKRQERGKIGSYIASPQLFHMLNATMPIEKNSTIEFDNWLHSIIKYEVPSTSESQSGFFFAAKYLITEYRQALGYNVTRNLKEIIVSDPQHNYELKKWGTFGLSYSDRIIVTDKPVVDFNYNVLSMELAHHFILTLQSMHPSEFAYNDWNNLVHFAANHMAPYAYVKPVNYNQTSNMQIFFYNFTSILGNAGKIRQEIIREDLAAQENTAPLPINPYREPADVFGRVVIVASTSVNLV